MVIETLTPIDFFRAGMDRGIINSHLTFQWYDNHLFFIDAHYRLQVYKVENTSI